MRQPLVGQILKRISQLAIADERMWWTAIVCYDADCSNLVLAYRCHLNEADTSAGQIEIALRIDIVASRPPTLKELELETIGQKLENALERLESDDTASNVINPVLQKASDSLGLLGETLIHFDNVIQLMDGLASVSPEA